MEEKMIMVYVPLNEYRAGVEAKTRLEILKKATLSGKYGPSKEEILRVLGIVDGGNEDVHGDIPGTGE
ncbi:MAG: hypothetical protein ACRC36_03245 [Lacrimispora sphenoides]